MRFNDARSFGAWFAYYVGSCQPGREPCSNMLLADFELVKVRDCGLNVRVVPACWMAMLPSRQISVTRPPYCQLAEGCSPSRPASIHSSQWLWGRAMVGLGRLYWRSSSSGSNQTCFGAPGLLL